MVPKQRIVNSMPLTELWDSNGNVPFERGSVLNRDDVRRLLQSGAVRFVVADPGLPLRWVPKAESHAFWRGEARPHLIDEPELPIDISRFPDGHAYIATEWRGGEQLDAVIVLLERYH